MKSVWPRRRAGPPPSGIEATPAGFAGVRFSGDGDPQSLARFLEHLPPARAADQTEPLRILALSGGGAGGAFGAGALAGLSKAHARPVFDIVTGVSTGALIAAFAFVGEAWDARLTDGYTDGHASELLALRGLRPGPSLYSSEPLHNLVRRYVDLDLLAAVAAAHAEGRRLFVATANLDAQTLCIWDMGAIAAIGEDKALQLFGDVLVASASLPGLFPPKMIAVEAGGQVYEEMHVDGGAVSPLFVAPEALIVSRADHWTGGAVEVYALINTTLEPAVGETPVGAVPILMRSFELMLRSSYRSALRSIAGFCALNGFSLRVGSVPPASAAGAIMRFDRELMAVMFAQGFAAAQAGELWTGGVG